MRSPRSVVWLLILVTAAACTTEQTPSPPECDGGGDAGLDVETERVPVTLSRLASTSGLTSAAMIDGRLWMTQRSGRLVRMNESGSAETLLDISELVTVDGEGGLLDLAADPAGQRLYLSYLSTSNALSVVSVPVDSVPAGPSDLVEHLVIGQPSTFHVGGSLAFGPDGYLYVGVGDGVLPSQDAEKTVAQDLTSLRGKLLRIDPMAEGGYANPPDNPFSEGASEVWLFGLRNPWGFSFDPVSGDLWLPDVGESCWEEINLVSPNAGGWNLGWPTMEASLERGPAPVDYLPPVFEYAHDFPQSAVIGGVAYNGTIPGLDNTYLYADYGRGAIYAVTMDDDAATRLRRLDVSVPNPTRIVALPDGEAAVLSATAGIFLIEPGE